MSTENNKSNIYTVERDVVINAIKNSKKELRMLGTSAINVPWTINQSEFYEMLYEKYSKGDYEITIITESDPTLYSNALILGLDRDGIGVPIATLMETRQNSSLKLRNYFLSKNNKITGLEPVEDSNRNQLDILFTEKLIKNICIELVSRGHELDEQFGMFDLDKQGILSGILDMCMEKFQNSFENSNVFSYYITRREYYQINKLSSQMAGEIEKVLKEKMNRVLCSVEKIDELFKIASEDFEYYFEDERSRISWHFVISSKEIRTFCLTCVLNCLAEYEPRNYSLIYEYASKEAYMERMDRLKAFEEDKNAKQRFVLKQIFHPIPVQMLKIDGIYYATVSPLPTFDAEKFLYLGNASLDKEDDLKRFSMYEEYVRYFNVYFNSGYCAEETSKGNRKEIIYNHNSSRVIMGQMPRDSFYGSDNYKLVMWALIFDRKGRILIHKRSQNAKDNQGMWDKSVGGHISIYDRDIIMGASREIAEELYTVEEEEQGHTKNAEWTSINEDKIIYLGKWKEKRYPNFVSNLHLESDEFYSFSFESEMTNKAIDSMRVLPDGKHITAKCFANLYFVITSEEFELSELKNSKYLVMSPDMIKMFARKGEITSDDIEIIRAENPEMDIAVGRFEVTPDLNYMISSPEWDNEITKFSIRVKEAFSKEY